MNSNGEILINAIRRAAYITIELPGGERIKFEGPAPREIASAVERSIRIQRAPARRKTPEEMMRELQQLVRNS